ncbi:hypothetical protein BJV82DRAFT_628118 [Fennellomyces sp. T-0311]|nr:hypothetical protein BJV82DRAFT_628118 [Fennellomyces sp. T-0311]
MFAVKSDTAEEQHHRWPFDIILSVLSFTRLIDLGRLLQQASGDHNLWDYCSYTIQSRAKAEGWELRFYTSAGYMAALCHGDRNREAIIRLRCTGYDTQEGFLKFESAGDSSTVIMHERPSSLKLICAQWPCPPAAEDQTHDIPIVWSPGVYRQRLAGTGHIHYSISSSKLSGDTAYCRQCHASHSSVDGMNIRFQNVYVTFDWLRQGLQ